MKKINVGLASFGMSGQVFHGPLLSVLPGFELKYILERTKNLSKDKYKAEIVRSYEELVTKPDLALVVVNTPDNTHYDMVKRALEGGKHVVVEKPFTLSVSEGERLIKLAREKGLLLSVFQNRRWDGDFLTVKKIIENQMLGRVVEFESHFDRYRNYIQDSWKEDPASQSGTIYNLGSHMIDQALQLFGMPDTVWADIRYMRTGARVDDNYLINLGYDEILVTLKGGYLVREAGPRYIVHGTDGSFLKYGTDPQEEALKKGRLPDEPEWGKEMEGCWGVINTNLNDLHIKGKIETIPGDYNRFYQNIYDVLVNNADLLVKPEQALNVIRIIEAGHQSNKENTVVPVS